MEIPRSAHWGGFKVVPFKFKFLEGRIDRLHERVLYQKENDIWLQSFLSP